ncbi:MAG: hexokinase [Candidatus Omnitrophica bacterium]|nr:hexokinase [Candidatus Omnitrophota bacterium]
MNLKNIDSYFSVSLSGMRKIIKDFQSEMEKGLSGKKCSLKMIPTYVDKPTGEEKGRYIALDLGGTNFRILGAELKGNGKYKVSRVKKFVLGKRYITGTARQFFDFIAGCIKTFIKRRARVAQEERAVGFTFSFPVEQTGTASGTLLRWTKGFNVKGVIGHDVVRLLNEALARKGLPGVRIAALANDTVGTLVSRAYEDRHCDIGVILGTGTNACYLEELSNISKWHGYRTSSGRMIVNIEWGNFDSLPMTSYDGQVDRTSDRTGQQTLEKMVSGMYLGEITRLILKDLLKWKMPQSFKTEYMSVIESDESASLSRTGSLLKKIGIKNSTIDDRRLIKKICVMVSLRASRISAAAIAAVIRKIDPALSRNHTVAIDGTLYEKHPRFSDHIKDALKEIFGKKASRIKTVLTKDGSGKGAAIIAATATHDYHD